MPDAFHFDLVYLERMVFSGEVEQVDVPGAEGDFGVLAHHAPLIAMIKPGILTVFEGDRDEYSGDAQFPNLPHADSRLISYSLDQKTLIDQREASDQLLASL